MGPGASERLSYVYLWSARLGPFGAESVPKTVPCYQPFENP
jgi:hypothetical protein